MLKLDMFRPVSAVEQTPDSDVGEQRWNPGRCCVKCILYLLKGEKQERHRTPPGLFAQANTSLIVNDKVVGSLLSLSTSF